MTVAERYIKATATGGNVSQADAGVYAPTQAGNANYAGVVLDDTVKATGGSMVFTVTDTVAPAAGKSWFTTSRITGIVLIIAVLAGFAWWYFKK